MVDTAMLEQIGLLYQDSQRCAEAAGLTYVSDDEPGIRRRRRGRGFSYRGATDLAALDTEVKERILAMAIPPAWTKVWICPDENGHILATGEDDKGRKQYVYHPQWRALRDLLNYYRLVGFAAQLPVIRRHVAAQLRRRTLDRDQVLATMIRMIDLSGVRIGNEVYAEENESFGLSTLTRRHVAVRGDVVELDFPAKSGKQAELVLHDRAVARVVGVLAGQRRRRLFTIGGDPIDASDVNARLLELTGEHVTAKEFRTWRGTVTVFAYLRAHVDTDRDREAVVVDAIDAAADALGNTRAVARAHYVHPHVVQAFVDGRFAAELADCPVLPEPELTDDEQMLTAFLAMLVEREFG